MMERAPPGPSSFRLTGPGHDAAIRAPRPRRRVSGAWWPMMLLSLLFSVYALGYLVIGRRLYPPDLAASFIARPWGIYTHAAFAMLALAIGPFQFLESLRARWLQAHRVAGRI